MAPIPPLDLIALAQRHGAPPPLALIVAAAALAESGGDPLLLGDYDAQGVPHSAGLYQMHDQGAGAGWSIADRQDPDKATAYMVRAEFLPAYTSGQQRGFQGEVLARWTYMRAERPQGWRGIDDPGLYSPAAERFATQWRRLVALTTPQPPASSTEAWIQAMLALRGTPYVFGGKDPRRDGGLDCSGLLTYAARQVGLDVGDPDYTDADTLRRAAQPLADDAPRRGCFVCFHSTYGNYGPGYATHIGVWLGPGQMLDSHDARGVGVTNLYDPYWQAHWLGLYWHPALAAPADPPPADATPSVDDLLTLLGYLTHDVHGALQTAWADAQSAHADRLAARSAAQRQAADARWQAAAQALDAALDTLRRSAP